MKILVLCHGNINRSAACAAVLKARSRKHEVRSAGFVGPGKRAAKKMREALHAKGYNLEEHRSQLVTEALLDWADKVIIMDGGNAKRLEAFIKERVAFGHGIRQQYLTGNFTNIHLLGEWARPKRPRVPDPNYMKRGPKFEEVVDLIIDATLRMGRQLKREL